MTSFAPVEGERDRRPLLVLAGLIGLYMIVFGTLTWRQQSNFGTFGFDHGIFDQEVWLMSRGFDHFLTTRGLTIWANHINPILYLLVPFYWFGAGAHFLYLVQTAALAAGAIPLFLLARDKWENDWLAIGIAVPWLLYPSVQWITWWHFHPETMGVPALLFAWWFATKERWRWFAVCLVLVAFCKEDTGLVIFAMGAAVALKYNRKAGLWTMAAAVAWFVTAIKILYPVALGGAAPFYTGQYAAFGDSMNEIIYNAIRHPSRVLDLMFKADRIEYYRRMLLPIGFVSFLAPTALLIALPTVMVNALNGQGYQHSFKFHYQSFVMCGLFIAVVEAIGDRKMPWRRFMVAGICATALATNVLWSPSPLNDKEYNSGIWAKGNARTTALQHAVDRVPGGGKVAASYTIVPHMTHRKTIYEYPNPFIRSYYGISETDPVLDPTDVDWLVLDTTLNADKAPLLEKLTGPGGQFRIVFQEDTAIVAKRVRPQRASDLPYQ